MTRIGFVARFKPLHLAHAAVLEALLARAGPGGRVVVGVGSANRRGLRNPFTAAESLGMLEAFLAPRLAPGRVGAGVEVALVPVPDLGDGPRWARALPGQLGPLDRFVTANPWVAALLADAWPAVAVDHPRDLVPRARWAPVSGERVRRAMARGEAGRRAMARGEMDRVPGAPGWRDLVPPEVADFMDERGLAARFRAEHGLATLALEVAGAPAVQTTAEEEERHVLLG